MSILVRGMEMPTSCYRCRFSRMSTDWDKNGEANILFRCVLTGEKTWDYTGGYLPNYPLVSVPPHGRLIDADEAIGHLFNGEQCLYSWDEIEEAIDATETVIPAEEDE